MNNEKPDRTRSSPSDPGPGPGRRVFVVSVAHQEPVFHHAVSARVAASELGKPAYQERCQYQRAPKPVAVFVRNSTGAYDRYLVTQADTWPATDAGDIYEGPAR